MTAIAIRPERLLQDLETLRGFGRSGRGVVRRAFSEADIAARRWLAGRMAEAGLTPRFDPAGNLFGLPPGAARPLLTGSHSDSQPEGGWLDGAYGVIAGLEVARASLEAGGPPVAAVSFQDEEGRFGLFTGSQFWNGDLGLEAMDALRDLDGVELCALRAGWPELAAAGRLPPDRFSAFLEIHIEQGPVLDQAGEAIGVVEAIVGIRQVTVTLTGQQNHAGTTPMALRRDAFAGLCRFSRRLDEALAEIVSPTTVWTLGHVALHPNAASVVPGRVRFTVQWRDGSTERLDRMEATIRAIAETVAEEGRFGLELADRVAAPPTPMDPALVAALAAAAEALAPGSWRRMPSGALHDATNAAKRLPTAMLFVPSLGGLSHDFGEDTRPEDLVLGAQVLAEGIGRIAARLG